MSRSQFDTGRAYWRSAGLCVDCGASVELPDKYIRCKKCRDFYARKSQARKGHIRSLKPNLEGEHVVLERSARNCSGCVWRANIEGTIFCPFPEGVCMR